MGDSFILEEPDDEGIAISMRTNTNKKKKVSFSINIIFNKIIYSTQLIWILRIFKNTSFYI